MLIVQRGKPKGRKSNTIHEGSRIRGMLRLRLRGGRRETASYVGQSRLTKGSFVNIWPQYLFRTNHIAKTVTPIQPVTWIGTLLSI